MGESIQNISKKEIIQGIRDSRKDILEPLYRKYYPMIYKMIIANKGNQEDARDIFQDAMTVLYRKSHQSDFQLTSGVGTYLYAVCQRLWLNKLNRQKNREQLEQQVPDQPEEVDLMDEENTHQQHILRHLLNKIGKSCRNILMKKYFEQRRDKEIAQELNLSGPSYVKTQRYRCLRQLKNLYAQMLEKG